MTTDNRNQPNARVRLESWKEIAVYLQRDVRTVIRWEKAEGLPVRRHHHLSRSSVYAYASELEAWRANRKPAAESTRSTWWRPVPAFASMITLSLALMMAGSGPHVGALVQAADGIVTRQVWAGPGVGLEGAVSPDGRFLTFADWSNAYGELAIRDLGTGESRHLTKADDNASRARFANRSVFSPDGRQVAYSWFNADEFFELRVIGLNDSQPRVLYRSKAGWSVEPMAWSPDGKSVVAWEYPAWPPSSSRIVAVSLADGTLKVLKSLKGQVPTRMGLPPNGRYLAYDASPTSESNTHDIFLMAADGGAENVLVEHPANDYLLDWTPDGNGVLFASDRAGNWGAWLISISDGKPQGNPRLVKSDIGQVRPLGFTGKGAFYYGVGGSTYDVHTAEVDLTAGKVLSPPTPVVQRFLGSNGGPAYSPDGENLAYVSRRTPGSKSATAYVLCVRNLRSGEERELSPDLNWFDSPRWSPDGRSMLVTGFDRRSRIGVFRIDSRTGETVTVLESGKDLWAEVVPPQWSRDGKSIFYAHCDGKGLRCRLLLRELATRRETVVAQIEEKNTRFVDLALSADGRRLAVSIWDDGRKLTRLAVLPPAGGAMTELLREEGVEPIRRLAWTPDSRQLLFAKRTNAPPQQRRTELWRISAEGGAPRSLGVSMREIDRLAVHPDGRRIAFSASEYKGEVWVMENFLPGSGTQREGGTVDR